MDLNQIALANQLYRQKQERELQEQIPCPVRFEDDFQSIFAGDEQPVKPVNINQAMFDAGHKSSDF